MRNERKRLLLAAASIALMPVLGSPAFAQYRVGGDGHALDANNRQGSGGYNDTVHNNVGVSGNDIVVGNVTAGRQFRGGVPYGDPFSFRRVLPGTGVDAFIRDSSGSPQPFSPQYSLNQARPFYGSSRGVAPPEGSVREGFTGSYIGTSLTPENPYRSLPGYNDLSDQRLGSTEIVGVPPSALPNSLLVLPGSIDSSNPSMQSYLSGSPLYGIRETPSNLQQNGAALNNYLNNGLPGQPAPSGIDRSAIDRMQRELQTAGIPTSTPGALDNSVSNPALNTSNSSAPGSNGPGTAAGNGLNTPINSAVNTSVRTSINSRAIDNSVQAKQNSRPDAINGLVPPEKQSSQYNTLQQRLQQFNSTRPGITVIKTNPNLKSPGSPATPGAGRTGPGGAATQPSVPGFQGTRPQANAEPVKLKSLADGIQAKGLHDLLASAEDLMRQDQFKSALEKYDTARRVAPNNSLIDLGRVNAELGAGSYFQAETDLRRAIAADPVLLMAQVDLKNMYSQKRLDFVRSDLKELANKDSRSERPWLLLAYFSYNTGDTATAAADLKEAKARSSARDTTIGLMEKYWSLGGDQQPAKGVSDLNK